MAGGRPAVAAFRRDVRRLCAQFLGQRIPSDVYLARVRKAADVHGLGRPARRTRDDRLLDALAFGTGNVAPGALPAALEPWFERHAEGLVRDDELVKELWAVLDRVRREAPSP